MGILNSSFLNHLLPILLLHLPFLLCVIGQRHGRPPPAPPELAPTPSPLPPPLPPAPSVNPPPIIIPDQRLVVAFTVVQKFKETITSDPLGITSTWVGGDVCKYKGFYCDSPPDNKTATALAGIDFNGFHLSAPSLDGFIDALPDLAIFHANSNNFSGTISPKIAQLPYFYELDLSNNNFSGVFPPAVFAIPGLSFLDIRYNTFSGTVPRQIFNQRLDAFFINNNNFIQRIPYNLGNTPARYITFANNQLSGPIPRTIRNTSTTLTEILFLNNNLSGCLPYEVGSLKRLTVFDVGGNNLTGPLPSSLGCLQIAEELNFAGNFFYGKVPEEVCALGNLQNLTLYNNYFTDVGPICRTKIKKGIVDVRKNCIRDLPDQKSITECANFRLKPKTCPDLAKYLEVPCRDAELQRGQKKKKPSPSPSPKVSYSALVRHR